MRERMAAALLLLLTPGAWPQKPPADWKIIQDSKGLCRISVPADWTEGAPNTGSAFFKDSTTGIAVVTSQPGQQFRPFSASFLKVMNIPKEKVFENTARRVFYQDTTSRGPDEPNAISSSVPGRDGTCSCRVAFLKAVPEDAARKIALSLEPVPPPE